MLVFDDSLLVCNLLLNYLFFVSLGFGFDFVFDHFDGVVFFDKDTSSYEYINSVINSSFDVTLIFLFRSEVIDEYFRDLIIGEFSIFKEEFSEFSGNEFKSFDLILVFATLWVFVISI